METQDQNEPLSRQKAPKLHQPCLLCAPVPLRYPELPVPYLLRAWREHVLAPCEHPAWRCGQEREALSSCAAGAAGVQLQPCRLQLVKAPQSHLPHAAGAGDHREVHRARASTAGTEPRQERRSGMNLGPQLQLSQQMQVFGRTRGWFQLPAYFKASVPLG